MAKFCTKCGKALDKCVCEKDKSSTRDRDVDDVVENVQVGEYVNNYLDIIKGMIKSPIKTIKKYSKVDNFNLSIISIVINAIIFGLFIHVMASNTLKAMGLNMNDLTQGIDEIKSYLSQIGISMNLDTNFGIKASLLMGVMSIVLVLVMYFMHSYVFKKKIDYKKITNIVGVSEVYFTVGLLVSLILSYVNVILACLVALYFVIMFFACIHQGMLEISTISDNKIIYIVAVGILVPLVMLIIYIGVVLLLNIIILLADSGSSYARSNYGL